ncbi:MAG: LPXTG cell wall anchor domain-containing protein [Clostridium paraputrificum]
MQILLWIILYKVTDSHGASALKTITVVVNPKLEIVKPENNNPTVESKPEVDKKPTDTTIENTTNKLPNTGVESSLPLLGVLSLTMGTALSLKKKQK